MKKHVLFLYLTLMVMYVNRKMQIKKVTKKSIQVALNFRMKKLPKCLYQ